MPRCGDHAQTALCTGSQARVIPAYARASTEPTLRVIAAIRPAGVVSRDSAAAPHRLDLRHSAADTYRSNVLAPQAVAVASIHRTNTSVSHGTYVTSNVTTTKMRIIGTQAR